MRNQRGSAVMGVIIALAVVFFVIVFLSVRGWGYPGYYYGRIHQPSFWYWGGPGYYDSPSVRTGSVRGPSHRGGGPKAGK